LISPETVSVDLEFAGEMRETPHVLPNRLTAVK